MKKKPESRTSGFLIIAIILFLVIFAGGALLAQRGLSNAFQQFGGSLDLDVPASADDKAIHFVVRPGDTAAVIAQRLEEVGLVRSALTFRMQARSQGVESRLAAGEYDLRPNMRPSEIVRAMLQAKEPGITITFPEGWRMEEMADRIAAQGIVNRDDFLKAARTDTYGYQFLSGRAVASLEGFLFPDTYVFPRSITATLVIDAMLRDFDRRFDISMRQQAERAGQTPLQVVTLASIVEREAVTAEERPMIAEVFLNRLARKMPLQADPTVQYAVAPRTVESGGYWKRELSLSDLQTASPYNTYAVSGLPPGAICNPGLAAIKAVLAPTATGYLYFVAKSDGTHAFARTLEEHNENVAQFQGPRRPR